MSLDFEGSYIDKAALVVMHYQVDVFAILFGDQPSPLLDKGNALIRRWRVTGRPLFFPNFFLGENYERASQNNRLISSIVPTGRFRNSRPMQGLAIEPGDHFYACPRASVFYGTSLDADLRMIHLIAGQPVQCASLPPRLIVRGSCGAEMLGVRPTPPSTFGT